MLALFPKVPTMWCQKALKFDVFDHTTVVWRPRSEEPREYLHKLHISRNCNQGHPRSLILVPVESAYATSYYSSIVTLVLSGPVSEILRFSAENNVLTPILPELWGCSPWTRLPMLGLRDPKLIIRVIFFEVTRLVWPRYLSVTDRQTDGVTTFS